jgi:hypothetical protein
MQDLAAPTRSTGVPTQLSLFDIDMAARTPLPAVAAPTVPPPPAPELAAGHAPTAPTAPTVLSAGAPAPRELRLGEHRIAYALRRARRHTIGFVVGPQGLTVSAPRWVGVGEVEAALRAKAPWILRKLGEQQERQRRLEAARIDWRDDTSVPFLGKAVIVRLDPGVAGAVLQVGDESSAGGPRLTLHLGLPPHARPEQMRDAVQGWLQRQARRVFEERCALFSARLQVRPTRLVLSTAASRWGSASADGSIRLNWRLVHFALPVIDYVVAHELAHLREMNHGPAFWAMVRQVLPGFESARGALRTEVLPVFE